MGKMIKGALSFGVKRCMHTALVNCLQKASMQWNIIQNGVIFDKVWLSTSGVSLVLLITLSA